MSEEEEEEEVSLGDGGFERSVGFRVRMRCHRPLMDMLLRLVCGLCAQIREWRVERAVVLKDAVEWTGAGCINKNRDLLVGL